VYLAPPLARLTSARKSSMCLEALDRSRFKPQECGAVENNYLVTAGALRTDLGFFGPSSARCSRVLIWVGWRRPPVRWRAAHQTLPAFGLFTLAARSLRSRTMATSGPRMNKPTQAMPSRSKVALHPPSCQHQVYCSVSSCSRRSSASPSGAA
jgi:hypothetical protein